MKCNPQKIKTNCYKKIESTIEDTLYKNLKISTQADGVFLFRIKIIIENKQIKSYFLRSNYDFYSVEIDLKTTLDKLLKKKINCDGEYIFKIIIDTVDFNIKVSPCLW